MNDFDRIIGEVQDGRLYSLSELAELSGIDEGVLFGCVQNGRLKAQDVDGIWHVYGEDFLWAIERELNQVQAECLGVLLDMIRKNGTANLADVKKAARIAAEKTRLKLVALEV